MRSSTQHLTDALHRIEGATSPRIDQWRITLAEMIADGDYSNDEAIMAATGTHRAANAESVPVRVPRSNAARSADMLRARGQGLHILGRQTIIR